MPTRSDRRRAGPGFDLRPALLILLGLCLLGLAVRLRAPAMAAWRLMQLRRGPAETPEVVVIRLEEREGGPAPRKIPAGYAVAANAALEKAARLRAETADCFGWLTIPGTRVDVPVMFTPEEPQYYLRRDFTGAEAVGGTPFLGGGSRPDASMANLLIYGHNMKDGGMFGGLKKYLDPAYYAGRNALLLAAGGEARLYEIVALVQTDLAGEDPFPFYAYACIEDERAYLDYCGRARALSLLSCDWEPRFCEALVTLVTCSGYGEQGRLVLIAREIA